MAKYIQFNSFNIYFKYILLYTLIRYLNTCLLGHNHSNSFEEVNLNKFIYTSFGHKIKIDLANFRMTEFFFNFIGTFIFSIISRFSELYYSGNKIKNFFQINDPFLVSQRKIFVFTESNFLNTSRKNNVMYKFKKYLVNNSSVFVYIIISFFWVAQEILILMFYEFLRDVDFWFFEILIVTIIFSNIFLVKVYTHQKFAIGINLIPSIFKIVNIVLRFFCGEPAIYTEYPWWIPIGFLGYLILIGIIAFINCSIKSFIDLKYTTISQILMFYSLVGIVVCGITCVIITYVPCSEINNSNFVDKKMCKLEYKNNLYFDTFIYYFSSFSSEDSFGKLIRTITIILDSLTFFLKEYFYLLVITYLDPVHITFAQPIFFILKKIILITNNLIRDKKFFKDTEHYKPVRFYMDIAGDIVCFFGFLVYHEIMELKFCDLNNNLRKYIIERGISDDLSIFKHNKITDDETDDDSISNQSGDASIELNEINEN